MSKIRPAYHAKFRREMVELVRTGSNLISHARKFHPTRQTIQNWITKADRGDRWSPAMTSSKSSGRLSVSNQGMALLCVSGSHTADLPPRGCPKSKLVQR